MADRVMDKDPGRIIADLRIDLPHPRLREDARFLEVVDWVYATLAGHTQPEHIEFGTAPGEPGRTRALPDIAVNELSGLLERPTEMPHLQADIYHLTGELRLDTGRLLHLTEAAELLGFITIAHGDITLTPLGETFAAASILTRKEIFATRIRRLPLFRWLLALLHAAEKRQIEAALVQVALELAFPPEEAKRQLDTAVRWGRYAELLAYDDKVRAICLEPAGATPLEPGPQFPRAPVSS